MANEKKEHLYSLKTSCENCGKDCEDRVDKSTLTPAHFTHNIYCKNCKFGRFYLEKDYNFKFKNKK